MKLLPMVTEGLVWEYPPLALLEDRSDENSDTVTLKKKVKIIEDVFHSNEIKATVVEINIAPHVIQFATRIPSGIKRKEIESMMKKVTDALDLDSNELHFENPIPRTTNLGIEIPNKKMSLISLKNLLASDTLRLNPSHLAIPVGLNITGNIVVTDLAKSSTLAICGKIGSGKTMFLCTTVESLVFRNSPETLRLILIAQADSKIHEFDSLPHLLTPNIHSSDEAITAIQWCHNQMQSRLKLFREANVTTVAGYNELSGYSALPCIVVVIDGLEDVFKNISKLKKEFDELAMSGDLAGISLIITNQKPILMFKGLKGIGKIAFELANARESLSFIKKAGAEKLLGTGDMLFSSPDIKRITRIQAPYISEVEIKNLDQFLNQSTNLA